MKFIMVKKPICILQLPPACSATSTNFYLHLCYENSPEESTGDTASIWTLFSHKGVYVMAIG